MSQQYEMTQRRVETIVRSLDVINAEIQESHFDCASCHAQLTLVDVAGWCRELLAERLALKAENSTLRASVEKIQACPNCNGTGGRLVVLLNLGRCKACQGSGRQ